MKLPLSWIYDYTDIKKVSPKDYADAMTMSGSKVEGIEEQGTEIQNVVVGKILKKEKHPNADTLWVCQVSAGDETLQIVTGAQNINEGDVVPLAKNGALLPGEKKIKAGKLRGEVSEGMLCSHEELNLEFNDIEGAHEDGILIFQQDYPLGQDVKKILGLDDNVIEFEITSNRPDCLGVIGLARESAATFKTPFEIKKPVVNGSGGDIANAVNVVIKDPSLCPRYTARVVKNVKIEPSPKWIRDRLTACGVRPVNNIVDITNYVMLEYGQPMHAFDKACLDGDEIIVRRANDGEKITSLDGTLRTLSPDMLVIADTQKPIALAGVMGGENSEISENTKDIVFESASFNGASVRTTSKKLGLRTESSARFEKGIDCEMTLDAVNRACELVELLNAGEVLDGALDVYPQKKEIRVLPLETDKINKLLGTDLDTSFMTETLQSLGFDVDKNQVTIPSWRDDVLEGADIAEEVARIYGYDNIPSGAMAGTSTIGIRTFEQETEEKICETLSMLGYYEVLTYSFTHPKSLSMLRRAEELEKCIKISNPLGEENSIMRNNMLHSLLEVLETNQNRSNQNVRIFEMGTVYLADRIPLENLPREEKHLALGGFGDMDFYDLKGTIEELFRALKVSDFSFSAYSNDASFHPGICSQIFIGGKPVGVMGEAHPEVLEKYSLDETAYLAEISFSGILSGVRKDIEYKPLNRFPAVTRDIAVLVDDGVPAAEIENAILKYAGKNLEELHLFDVYKGKQIPEDKKSMAYSATFRAVGKTLSEEDVSKIMDKLLKMLAKETGAELR